MMWWARPAVSQQHRELHNLERRRGRRTGALHADDLCCTFRSYLICKWSHAKLSGDHYCIWWDSRTNTSLLHSCWRINQKWTNICSVRNTTESMRQQNKTCWTSQKMLVFGFYGFAFFMKPQRGFLRTNGIPILGTSFRICQRSSSISLPTLAGSNPWRMSSIQSHLMRLVY